MTYEHGDVLLVIFPDSNLVTARPRPAIVVMANDLRTGLSQTMVAMITTNLSRGGHPSRVVVAGSSLEALAMGLSSASVIMTDNLATVLHANIHRRMGRLQDMHAVEQALRHTLGL